MDIFKLPVFPPADVFPMIADDELQELAADIKENGLRDALVVAEIDGQMMLVDGRNRRVACEIAEVNPTTRQLNGEDPTAFVLSANIHRRHMTKGQRAMAVAIIRPKQQGKKSTSSVTEEVSAERISLARTVLCYSIDDDLANDVLAGARSLDDAYKKACERKDAASSEESQLADLRQRFPKLADKVIEGELTLTGARAEADERESRERAQRANIFVHLGKITTLAAALPNDEFAQKYAQKLLAAPDEFKAQERYSSNDLVQACDTLCAVLPILKSSIEDPSNES